MLEVKNLSYKNKKFELGILNFDLQDGYLMTLLGKNGAGKTTLLDLIYGCLQPDSGRVLWNGADVTGHLAMEQRPDGRFYHEEAAYVGTREWCIESDSCADNISLFKELYPSFDPDRLAEIFALMEFKEEDLKTKYMELSTGKKMQFQLAFCLARHPKLLLLDEPMANLDPVVKTDLWDLLLRAREQENLGIIISTHLVEEVNDITDYVGLMEDGQLTCFGDREQILGEHNLRSLFSEERK